MVNTTSKLNFVRKETFSFSKRTLRLIWQQNRFASLVNSIQKTYIYKHFHHRRAFWLQRLTSDARIKAVNRIILSANLKNIEDHYLFLGYKTLSISKSKNLDNHILVVLLYMVSERNSRMTITILLLEPLSIKQ